MRTSLHIDDASIVEECRQGNKEAFSLLYSRHAPRMLMLISRYIPDKDDAKDILHDGFIAAFTRLDTLKEPDRLEHWLATIMKNLSLKFLQQQSVMAILHEIPENIEDSQDIEEIIDFDTLETLIQRLPDGYQKVFRLAVLENKSHKEISKILGIAPNSSSSQLFHAKLLLRKFIAEYKGSAGLALLLFIVSSYFLIVYHNNSVPEQPAGGFSDATSSKQAKISSIPDANEDEKSATSIDNNRPLTASNHHAPVIYVASNSEVSDSVPDSHALADNADAVSAPDSLYAHTQEAKGPSYVPHHLSDDDVQTNNDYADYNDYLPSDSRQKGWSAAISFDPGIAALNSNSDHLADFPPGDNLIISEKDYLPISAGLSLQKHLAPWVGVETGLTYTYIHKECEYRTRDENYHWHYIGIPVKLNLYAYSSSKINVYGSVGGAVDIPIYSARRVYSKTGFMGPWGNKINSSTIWSLSGSVGISIPLAKKIEIYAEPTIRYNFPSDDGYMSNIWTDNPWTISIPIGVRFNW